jgi:hypothetical protein
MESAGLITFQPHYLLWVCQYGAESDECKTQCIRQGAYCCPDPDDNIHEGYSGAEVLLVSFVKQLSLLAIRQGSRHRDMFLAGWGRCNTVSGLGNEAKHGCAVKAHL